MRLEFKKKEMGFGGPFDTQTSAPPSPPFPPLNPPLTLSWYFDHTDRTTKTVHVLAICIASAVIFMALYVGLAATYDFVADARRSREMQQHKQALRAVREDDETDEDEEEARR